MSSDADYLAFLDKANAQREAGASQTLSQSSEPYTQTVDTGVIVPEALTSIDEYYVSETDEPFEPVALKWPEAAYGKWPGGDIFASLVTGTSPHPGSVDIISEREFDPGNRYAAVFHAVRAATSAYDTVRDSVDIKIYRMEMTSTRFQYWILALDPEEGTIVGFRTKAVES